MTTIRSDYELSIVDAEVRLDKLRGLYEQYFQGVERVEPYRQRRDMERRIALLKKTQPGNTAMRFRLQQLVQRFVSYHSYWARITRQIEEGTYHRDVMKARARRTHNRELNTQRNADSLMPPISSIPAIPLDSSRPAQVHELSLDDLEEVKDDFHRDPSPSSKTHPRTSKRPPQSLRPSAKPSLPPRTSDITRLEKLCEEFRRAKSRNNEPTEHITPKLIKRRIDKLIPQLKQKHGTEKFEFRVITQNGRVGLRAIPKPLKKPSD